MIIGICNYCGNGILDSDITCGSCGAPLGRAMSPLGVKPQGLIARTKETLYSLTPSIVAPVNGVDLSYWNGLINFSVLASKVQFAFVRAGHGASWFDPNLDTYRDGLTANSVEFGLYWFLRIGDDIIQHVTNFTTAYKQNPGKLYPVLDAEYTTLGSKGATTYWLWEMCQRATDALGSRLLIYTSPGWWNANVVIDDNYDFTQYADLWVAHWTEASAPILPYGFDTYLFWQWSGEGNGAATEYGMISGGDTDMDLNRFNGDVNRFNGLFNTSIVPTDELPPPPIKPTIEEIDPIGITVVNTWALNVRAGDGVGYSDIGTLRRYTEVPVTDIRGDWYKIEGWIHSGYTTGVKEVS